MTIDLDSPTVQIDRSAPATLGPITLRNRIIETDSIIETTTTAMCA